MPLDLDKAVIAFREAVSRHNLTIPSVFEVLSNPLIFDDSSAVLYLSKVIHLSPCLTSVIFVMQVATTAYHNELIVLWGLSKSRNDFAWLAIECADKLLHRSVHRCLCALLMIICLPQGLVLMCCSLSDGLDYEVLLPYALMVALAPVTAAGKPSRPAGLQVGFLGFVCIAAQMLSEDCF